MNLNVIFLGCTAGYGYAFSASNTKVEFLARGLMEQGASVSIINTVVGRSEVSVRTKMYKDGIGNVITYPYHGSQATSWIKNTPDLKKDLKELYVKDTVNTIVLLAPDYHIYRLYCYLARKYGYRLAVISHEWLPTIKSIHPLRRPFSLLYTKTFGKYVDGILPISEYIIKKTAHFRKPYLKVPVLASFDGIPDKTSKEPYFLYCVYANYTRAILPVIDAFVQFKKNDTSNSKLILVLGGTDGKVKAISDYIENCNGQDSIFIKRKLPYSELLDLYNNSIGLIIPLDKNNEQDYARFSQKIAEYTSSASPIISCKVGEVDYYFTDKESAVLTDFTKDGFCNAFTWIIQHPEEASQIGINGYKLGEEYFNYKTVGQQLASFFMTL